MRESRCIRCTNPLRKSLSPAASSLRPLLCPFAVLTPARIRTVGGCYTVIYIPTSTAYIASRADDCVAFVYVRLAGSRLGWRCPGRVQAGWYMHITTSRAGWLHWADARCTGCRDLSRFSARALAKMTLLGGLYLEKTRVIVARDEVCAPVFISLVLWIMDDGGAAVRERIIFFVC